MYFYSSTSIVLNRSANPIVNNNTLHDKVKEKQLLIKWSGLVCHFVQDSYAMNIVHMLLFCLVYSLRVHSNVHFLNIDLVL